MIKAYGIIPARFASTRFPGKPLVEIAGKSMIRRVYEQCKSCEKLSDVIVATDDLQIFEHVKAFGGKVIMTSANHVSGTSRLGEVVEKITDIDIVKDIIVNIQGDEPFVDPRQIEKLVALLSQNEVQIGTLISRISLADDIFNPNIVKVITDKNGKALIFSRSPLPFVRGVSKEKWFDTHSFFRHIGMYAYKPNVLIELNKLPEAEIEKTESLEQLRWLFHGYSIFTSETDIETIGIDTPEDLLKLTNIA